MVVYRSVVFKKLQSLIFCQRFPRDFQVRGLDRLFKDVYVLAGYPTFRHSSRKLEIIFMHKNPIFAQFFATMMMVSTVFCCNHYTHDLKRWVNCITRKTRPYHYRSIFLLDRWNLVLDVQKFSIS